MARYTRAQWGAKPPKSAPTLLPWSRIDTLYVHYTSMASESEGDPRGVARAIQRFHQVTRGWNDIAYTHAFTDEGDILELRGWNVYTAATGIENGHSQALVFFGGDRLGRDDVTAAGRKALRTLVNEAFQKAGKTLVVKGHTEARDPTGQTACPGLELLSFIHIQNKDGWRWESRTGYKWPKRFFTFAAWYLGEGPFKQYGPKSKAHYPRHLFPRRIQPVYWAALRYFLAQRKKAA